MFDAKNYLIPLDARKALVVAESDWSLEEMEGLFTTLGGVIAAKEKVVIRKIDASSYLGSGKLEELSTRMKALNADVLLCDFDLSPSQLKKIEGITQALVLDRSGVILEIFSRHARTKEAKLQVDLARLEYLMPRLAHLWSHFERQRGSGGGNLKGKGMGEKQIEVDRRLVKDRLVFLRKRLKEAAKATDLQRKAREDFLQVAIVGYTNAGKSTLLNALTHSDVLVEDALFATLDSTVRMLNPKSRPAILAIDTVGFIDRLPHNLVASFRSTLSSVLEADLLVHVLDSSNPEVQRHFEVTENVLKELGAENIPTMIVFNKTDRMQNAQMLKIWAASLTRKYSMSPLFVSAYDKKSVDLLRKQILTFFEKEMELFEVVVPFEDGKTLAQICEVGILEQKRVMDTGTFIRFKTMKEFGRKFNFDRYKV